MGESTGRPPIPTPAERATTIATRGGHAVLHPGLYPISREPAEHVVPYLHHVHPDGTATLLLPNLHPLTAAASHERVTALLELSDPAPVPLREPVRGLVWITGTLEVLTGSSARARVLAVAERRSDPRLLDSGHGMQVLRLRPAALVLADGEGTGPVPIADFVDAEPDPFTGYESQWLRHLELSHSDVVGILSRHIPEPLRGGQVRPLGLDRWGLRLRVETVDADHDVRLAFSKPVHTTPQLAAALRRLVGCPFLTR
ncbi:MAG: DUF2470 domain-containing protein [Sciscionella sp.]